MNANILKQEALLRRALKERGLNWRQFDIKIDHDTGRNWVDGIEMGIIYPDSFFRWAKILQKSRKKYKYYFNGNMSPSGERSRMLAPFTDLPDAKIVQSNFGRNNYFKSYFNVHYFWALSSSVYGLCPHQKDWPGKVLWTYRFIDCLITSVIPIIFRETPLDSSFLKGFEYEWDDDALRGELSSMESPKKQKTNFNRALKVFSLPRFFI